MTADGEDKAAPKPAEDGPTAEPSDTGAGEVAAATDAATADGGGYAVPVEPIPIDASVPQLIQTGSEPAATPAGRLRRRLRARRVSEPTGGETPAAPEAPPAPQETQESAPAQPAADELDATKPAADESSEAAPAPPPSEPLAAEPAFEMPVPANQRAGQSTAAAENDTKDPGPSQHSADTSDKAGEDTPAQPPAEVMVDAQSVGTERVEPEPVEAAPAEAVIPRSDWLADDPPPQPGRHERLSDDAAASAGRTEEPQKEPAPAAPPPATADTIAASGNEKAQTKPAPDPAAAALPAPGAGRRQRAAAFAEKQARREQVRGANRPSRRRQTPDADLPPRAARLARPARPRVSEERNANRLAQRIEGNGTVMIGESLFVLRDWSVLGVAIPAETQIFAIGDRRTLELEIDMGDYAVNLDIDGEVVNRSDDRIGWRFLDPTETQRQVLRALAQATISSRPPNFAGGTGRARPFEPEKEGSRALMPAFSRPERRNRSRGPGRFAGILSLPLNAVIIALLSGAAIYALTGGEFFGASRSGAPEGPLLIRAENAAVAVKRIDIEAPFSGTVIEWTAVAGQPVNQNALLVTMLTDDEAARRIIIKSPCDCYLTRINKQSGDVVQRRESLGVLYARGSAGVVHALFAPQDTPQPGDIVSVSLPYSGDEFRGEVEYVGVNEDPDAFIGLPPTAIDDSPQSTFARIRTEPALPASKAGDPAVVTFTRAPGLERD